MPQFAYGNQPVALNGQVADGSAESTDSYINEIVAQQSNIASGGGNALITEVYSITAVGADGSSVTVQTAPQAGGETPAQVVTELVAAWNADPEAAGIALATDNGGDMDLDFIAVGVAFTVTTVAPTSTLTVSTPQAAGGANIGLAVAVQYGATDESAIAAGAGMVDADVPGFTIRNMAIQVQETPSGAIVNDQFAPGEMLSVMRQGTLHALAEDAVTKGAPVFVRIANVTVAGDPLGMPRSDADGGDAIQLVGVRFAQTTTARGLVKIEVNRPAA